MFFSAAMYGWSQHGLIVPIYIIVFGSKARGIPTIGGSRFLAL